MLVIRHRACPWWAGCHPNSMSKPSLKLAATTLLVAGSSPVTAAVIVFDIDPNITLGQPFWFEPNLVTGNLNQGGGDAYQSPFAGPSFGLSLGPVESDGPTFIFSGQGITAGGDSVVVGTEFNAYFGYNTNVSDGRITSLTLGADLRSSDSIYAYGTIKGNIANFSNGTSYVALRLTVSPTEHQYGWLELTGNGSGGLIATRFAFDDQANAAWVYAGDAGAIPEPSTLGLVGGLFGLVAAAHLRRRKLKQVAASDKFLALAAGEKLN